MKRKRSTSSTTSVVEDHNKSKRKNSRKNAGKLKFCELGFGHVDHFFKPTVICDEPSSVAEKAMYTMLHV